MLVTSAPILIRPQTRWSSQKNSVCLALKQAKTDAAMKLAPVSLLIGNQFRAWNSPRFATVESLL